MMVALARKAARRRGERGGTAPCGQQCATSNAPHGSDVHEQQRLRHGALAANVKHLVCAEGRARVNSAPDLKIFHAGRPCPRPPRGGPCGMASIP